MSAEDIGTIAKNVVKALSVNMGFGIRQRSTTPLLSAKQLQDLGVAVVIYPRLLTACALQGMKNGLQLLKQSLASGKVVDRPMRWSRSRSCTTSWACTRSRRSSSASSRPSSPQPSTAAHARRRSCRMRSRSRRCDRRGRINPALRKARQPDRKRRFS